MNHFKSIIRMYLPCHVLIVRKDISEYFRIMFYFLLKFRKALLDGEQPLEAISLWVGFYLLEDHFHGRFDDLEMTSKLSDYVIKGGLEDNKLKVLILQYLSNIQVAALFRKSTRQRELKLLRLARGFEIFCILKTTCLCISLVEHPHGGDTIYLDIVLVYTSELLNEIGNESLGWFLVRV